MIKLKDILIEGFGSIPGPFFYSLSKSGINVISGDNGSGKTTIFSALCWVLYGKTLKPSASISPWEDRRGKSYSGTRVELNLQIDKQAIKIIRCKDYTKVIGDLQVKGASKTFLFIANQHQTLRDKADVQIKIEELLGMSFNLFKNSISFGQNLTRLLRESGPRQKEVFDEAFETTYINKAKSLAAKKINEYKDEAFKQESQVEFARLAHSNSETHVLHIKTKLHETNQEIEEAQEALRENREKTKKYKAISNEAKSFKEEIDKLLQKITPLENLSREQFKKEITYAQLEGDLKGLKDKFKKNLLSLSSKTPTCEFCGQPIKKIEEYKRKAKIEQKSLSKQIKKLSLQVEANRKDLAVNAKSLEDLPKFNLNLRKLQLQESSKKNNKGVLRELKTARLKVKAKLLKLHADRAKGEVSLSSLEDSLLEKYQLWKKEQESYKELSYRLELHQWLLKEPLSNSGLKAFIFNLMLNQINARLEYYSQFLGYLISFSIDLESAHRNFEVQIYHKKKARDYDDLSGGQQQLVDICLAFSIHDVVTDSKQINLLLMDEVFESLDSTNIELVSELLQLKSENTCLHLITHQQNLSFYKTAQHLHLSLQQGYTAVS